MRELPEYPSWRPVCSTDKELLDRYCQSHAPYADASLSTLLVWNGEGTCDVSELNGNLVLRRGSVSHCSGQSTMIPLGINRPIDTALTLLSTSDCAMKLVPDPFVAGASPARWRAAGIQILPDPDNDDYVYDTGRLASLCEPELRKKRKRRDRFVSEYLPTPCRLDATSESGAEEILRCAEAWFRQKETASIHPPAEEIRGLRRLLDASVSGEFHGLLAFGARVDRSLVAVSVVETHGCDTVSGVIFKAPRELHGAGEYLRSSSAAALLTLGYRGINVQQDLGLSGLRQWKSSFRPSVMLKKWIVQLSGKARPC